MVRVFLVLPDVSEVKVAALCGVAGLLGGGVDVLVSYTTLLWKPSTVSRLARLVAEGCVRPVLLDSGAYHLATRGFMVSIEGYAAMARRLSSAGVAGLVVAPDVPGDSMATLARSLEFAFAYGGPFMPVLQPPRGSPPDPLAHARAFEALEAAGLLELAPRLPGGKVLVGVGGLDGARRRTSYVASLIDAIDKLYGYAALHIFGAGARLLRSLARRGLLSAVYSVDTGAWQAEIRYRRRSGLGAETTLEANKLAIARYLERVRRAIEGFN